VRIDDWDMAKKMPSSTAGCAKGETT
jgi:hypothetical protein